MTTGGEGGIVTCNDRDLWSRMWSFKDHGKSWSAVYEREHPPGFRWLHESFGTNWRMTEMQGVLGRIQLTRMADWRSARQANAQAIWDTANSLAGLRVPQVPDELEQDRKSTRLNSSHLHLSSTPCISVIRQLVPKLSCNQRNPGGCSRS